MIRSALVVAASIGLLGTPLAAQNPHQRDGFWFTIGAGWGSFGCQDDCGDRLSGPSGAIGLGGALGQNVMLGVMINGWTREELGARLTAGTLTAALRLYPSSTGGFHILAGLGYSAADVSFGGTSYATENGPGAIVGLGWDIRVGQMVSLTPFVTGIGMRILDTNLNIGQAGLALTLH